MKFSAQLLVSIVMLFFSTAPAAPAVSGKALFERTIIRNYTKPKIEQIEEECVVFENWIELNTTQNGQTKTAKFDEWADTAYYAQSLNDLQQAQASLDAGGATGLVDATEYGMLSENIDQTNSLYLIDQKTPDSTFFTQSPRLKEWETFIDGKCAKVSR